MRKKMFLLYINIDSKCLRSMFNQEISLEESGKFYRTFRAFRVFIFRYRVKNENEELAKGFPIFFYEKSSNG